MVQPTHDYIAAVLLAVFRGVRDRVVRNIIMADGFIFSRMIDEPQT